MTRETGSQINRLDSDQRTRPRGDRSALNETKGQAMIDNTVKRDMPYDDATPPCRYCGEEHVGTVQRSHIMLRGSYMFVERLGHEVFVVDPKNKLGLITLPNGWQALIVDIDPKQEASAAMHEACAQEAVEALYAVGYLPEHAVGAEILEEEDHLPEALRRHT
jgi:hypothetical protein